MFNESFSNLVCFSQLSSCGLCLGREYAGEVCTDQKALMQTYANWTDEHSDHRMHAASAAHRMFLSDVSFGCKSTRALSDQRPSRRKLEQRESERVESLDMFRIFWKFRSFYCWCNRRQTLLNRLHTHTNTYVSAFTTLRQVIEDVCQMFRKFYFGDFCRLSPTSQSLSRRWRALRMLLRLWKLWKLVPLSFSGVNWAATCVEQHGLPTFDPYNSLRVFLRNTVLQILQM